MSDSPIRHVNPHRAEWVCYAGIALQAVCTLAIGLLAKYTESASLSALTFQASIGIAFWALTCVHLRMRRSAREEIDEVANAEKRRKQQGMQQLFDQDEVGRAARNLSHLERWVTPGLSILLAKWLLLPVTLWLVFTRGPLAVVMVPNGTGVDVENALPAACIAIFMSLACFLLGTYAAGLGRERACAVIRAGAGYSISLALFLFLAAFSMFAAKKGFAWIDHGVAVLIFAWMGLQAVEIVTNIVLDLYRPRIAGVDSRPAYDSRLSGLLAEPQGLFRTFSHTLDYQFGFKVSETWFFRFLEKAFVPLILIQLLTFYLLTCVVIVRPGEQAVVEYWGAPAGIIVLPEVDSEWDKLPPPLVTPGWYFKYPWPIARARVVPVSQVKTLTFGHDTEAEHEKDEHNDQAKDMQSWGEKHSVGGGEEEQYLMPVVRTADRAGKPEISIRHASNAAEEYRDGDTDAPDAVLLSVTFSVEYRVGRENHPGDIYRYLYRHRDGESVNGPTRTIRAVLQREITTFLAGSNFWDLIVDNPNGVHQELLDRMQASVAARQLGIEITHLGIMDVHPPAGDVGKAFQEVHASQEAKVGKLLEAETDRMTRQRKTPSKVNKTLTDARIESYRRTALAKARAERFRDREKAYAVSPDAFTTFTMTRLMKSIGEVDDADKTNQPGEAGESAAGGLRIYIVPKDVEIRLDHSTEVDPIDKKLGEALKAE